MKHVSSGSPYEPAIGFSRAVRAGNMVFVSGTAPIAPDGSTACPGDACGQARRCFEIAREAIEAAGATLEDVVRTRMFLTSAADWEAVGRAHGEFFAHVRPAATMVEVSGLIRPDWLVEIEVDCFVEEPAPATAP